MQPARTHVACKHAVPCMMHLSIACMLVAACRCPHACTRLFYSSACRWPMEADALVDAFYQLLIMGRCAQGKEGVGSQGQVHFISEENIPARFLAWDVYARERCVTMCCSARCLLG